jgi:acyl-CoA thioesterase-2
MSNNSSASSQRLEQAPSSQTGVSLIELMQVTATDTQDVFTARTETYGPVGLYGGHFLGQAMAAGLATVDESKLAHSYHAYFLRAGDPTLPLHYEVTRLREGRNGDTRAITAIQGEHKAFHMIVSFKTAESGDQHQPTAPVLEPPESIVAAREARGEPPWPFPVVQGGRVQMEWASPNFFDFDPKATPALQLWMRLAPASEKLTPRQRQIVMAYLSDGPLMFNSALPHGIPFQTHRLTSLDQSAWFHHDADPHEWMIFDQRSTAAMGGRGMNEGQIYSQDGRLLMTCAQESMFRKNDPD